MRGPERVRLCVQTWHPIHTGNYAGPIHCTAHPDGHPCVTALYERVPHTTVTEEERAAPHEPKPPASNPTQGGEG